MNNVTRCFFGFLVLMISFFATAETETDPGHWQTSGSANITATANTYSENWTGGENGAISWTAQLHFSANRQFSPKVKNENTLKLAFGQTHTQSQDASGGKSWESPEKSTDLVDSETLVRFTLQKAVDPFVGARLVTQFQDASVPTDKLFLNPLEFTESVGAARDITKKELLEWTARLGGAVRQLYDKRKTGKELTNDGGLELVSEYKQSNKGKSLEFTSQLKVYEALFSTAAEDTKDTPQENDWRYPDVNWENTLVVNLTKYLMLNLYVQALYDREIDSEIRLKETLAGGLTWAFGK